MSNLSVFNNFLKILLKFGLKWNDYTLKVKSKCISIS